MLPVPYSEFNYTPFDLARLEGNLQEHQSKLDRLSTFKQEVLEAVEDHNAELIEKSERFKAQYMDIESDYQRKLAAKYKRENDADQEDPDLDIDVDREQKPINRKYKKLAAKFFKKIANVCHPDKVGNKRLVHYYHDAMEAYKVNDVKALKDIWELLKDKHKRAVAISSESSSEERISNAQQLDIDIQNVKNTIAAVLALIEDIEEDEFYSVMEMYMRFGPGPAGRFHKSVLEETIKFYKEKIKYYEDGIKKLDGHFAEFDMDWEYEGSPFYFEEDEDDVDK